MENKFDFYSEEPAFILVKQNVDSVAENYFCFFRIRIWNSKGKCFSWSIYSDERECFSNLIVRRVIWDLELMRIYDWGQIHYIWCTDRKNEYIEKEIEKMIPVLNFAIDEAQDTIFPW